MLETLDRMDLLQCNRYITDSVVQIQILKFAKVVQKYKNSESIYVHTGKQKSMQQNGQNLWIAISQWFDVHPLN